MFNALSPNRIGIEIKIVIEISFCYFSDFVHNFDFDRCWCPMGTCLEHPDICYAGIITMLQRTNLSWRSPSRSFTITLKSGMNTATKNRPALVLSDAALFTVPAGNAVMAMITPGKNASWVCDCVISDLGVSRVASFVKSALQAVHAGCPIGARDRRAALPAHRGACAGNAPAGDPRRASRRLSWY